MAKSALDLARKLLRKRKFTKIVTLLEPLVFEYRDSFQFFYILGLSCLYLNDIKGAETYFKRARQMKLNDVNLILAQAVLFLKRGAIDKALEQCLDALDLDPTNKYVLRFLDMIKNYGDPDIISEWNHNGKLRAYYPPLPARFPIVTLISVFACILFLCFGVYLFSVHVKVNRRLDTSLFTIADKTQILDKGMGRQTYHYIFTQKEAENYYKKAQLAINDYDDNRAQMYINLLLNSNCSSFVQSKAMLMQDFLSIPTFNEPPKTVFSFSEISQDVMKYQNCWVIWSGRVTNIQSDSNQTLCTFLVGYEDFKKKDGDALLLLSSEFSLRSEKPLRVLAKIAVNSEGNLLLIGNSVYQPLEGDKL
ncbi:MAG: tetratricopeptide repeat protein [Treponemataceae bacterium]